MQGSGKLISCKKACKCFQRFHVKKIVVMSSIAGYLDFTPKYTIWGRTMQYGKLPTDLKKPETITPTWSCGRNCSLEVQKQNYPFLHIYTHTPGDFYLTAFEETFSILLYTNHATTNRKCKRLTVQWCKLAFYWEFKDLLESLLFKSLIGWALDSRYNIFSNWVLPLGYKNRNSQKTLRDTNYLLLTDHRWTFLLIGIQVTSHNG